MKKHLLLTLPAILLLILTVDSFSQQCVTINCQSNITTNADSNACGSIINYNTPFGFDSCLVGSQTFNYTGQIDTFIVPTGVTTLTIEATGAAGGNSTWATLRPGGKGSYIKGDVSVSSGDTILVLVGQQGESAAVGGGGGGSFTALINNTPLVIAGGGGGASSDQSGVNASITNNGTNCSGNLILGGTSGNGGAACGPNGNSGGAGGGFLTDGASSNTNGPSTVGGFGGKSFTNGGTGGIPGRLDNACTQDAFGGFGGGGSTSCNTVGGGGGGGYSGGAGGPHISQCGASQRFGGGGGGSFNAGTNTIDSVGVGTGNGLVVITWNGGTIAATQTSGLPSGSLFPIGTTTNSFFVTNGTQSDSCTFTVTVIDSIVPILVCPSNVVTCNSIVNGISPSYNDNCNVTVSYTLSGATVGSGNNDASGTTFNYGITTVQYLVSDSSGNSDTCSFTVTNNSVDTSVTRNLSTFTSNQTGASYQWVSCPSGTPIIGDTNMVFTATTNGSYAVIVSNGLCTDTSACFTINNVGIQTIDFGNVSIYPNPTNGLVTIDMGDYDETVNYTITSIDGRTVAQKTNIADNKITIDLGNESKGVYLLKLYNTKSSSVFRINRL